MCIALNYKRGVVYISNGNLEVAKRIKNDEFYTRIEDIKKELTYYKQYLQGKIIYCNCDDPNMSNFWLFFKSYFKELDLKKIISTHYNNNGVAYKLEYNGEHEMKTNLIEDGDFRSKECIDILKNVDIVITNPPFSLFREFISLIETHEKKFLILGNQNAITYKEIFKLLKENKIWLGVHSGSFEFYVTDKCIIGDVKTDSNGNKYVQLGNITWFTNLDIDKRNKPMILNKTYNENLYPKYDNYDAINVNKLSDIPSDYNGVMGVPITFMNVYNPEQFEIVGYTSGRYEFESMPTKKYINPKQISKDGSVSNGSKVNTRATILLTEIPNDTYYVADNADGPLRPLYVRILIKIKT